MHDQPSDVLILGLNGQDYVTVTNGEDTTTFQQQDGSITIPSATFENIVANHGKMSLHQDNQMGGTIYFRPNVESEQFDITGGISPTGEQTGAQSYRVTDYIDVDLADHIIYSGRVGSVNLCNIVAYDGNKNFVKVLLKNTETNRNVRIDFDESYGYIRASVVQSSTYKSLLVYYK